MINQKLKDGIYIYDAYGDLKYFEIKIKTELNSLGYTQECANRLSEYCLRLLTKLEADCFFSKKIENFRKPIGRRDFDSGIFDLQSVCAMIIYNKEIYIQFAYSGRLKYMGPYNSNTLKESKKLVKFINK